MCVNHSQLLVNVGFFFVTVGAFLWFRVDNLIALFNIAEPCRLWWGGVPNLLLSRVRGWSITCQMLINGARTVSRKQTYCFILSLSVKQQINQILLKFHCHMSPTEFTSLCNNPVIEAHDSDYIWRIASAFIKSRVSLYHTFIPRLKLIIYGDIPYCAAYWSTS